MADEDISGRSGPSSDKPLAEAGSLAFDRGSIAPAPEEKSADPPEHSERGRPPIKLKTWQVLAILALAAFTIFITWRTKKLERSVLLRSSASAMISKSAPEFALPALNGRTVSLADYRGKKTVVLSYWASWCGPCKVELPELREFYKQHHKTDANFEILAISIDEDRAEAEKYATIEKLPFPVLFDTQSKTADTYAVAGIPTLFVIDKNGKIVHVHTGLEQAMQVQLMGELGIQFPGVEGAGDTR